MTAGRLRQRYAAFAERVLASLSEIERHDVRVFDDWFYRESGWRWVVATFAAATLIAAVLSWLPWNIKFVPTAILLNIVVAVLGWAAMSAWFGYRKFKGRLLRFVLVTVAFVVLGAALGGTIADVSKGNAPLAWLTAPEVLRNIVLAALAFGFFYALLFALIATMRNREFVAQSARLEGEARQSELRRRLAESQLRLLQIQIEPHFLFNTLGSAQQLAEKGAPDAARLIADLIRFLRAATPAMREDTTTLRQEAAMAGAYLAIMQTRLRGRLAFEIDIPDSAAQIAVPPGMLITLVENAIKHGIEPLPAGGAIALQARVEPRADGAHLAIAVSDTGAGLGHGTPGQGIGLANIRDRLALLYGERASLELEENTPRGFVARLVLPLAPLDAPTGPAALTG